MMFLTSEMPADQPKLAPLKLAMSREQALRKTQELFLEGRQINALYICTDEELETANGRKLSWIGQASELLGTLFEGHEAADFFDEITLSVVKRSAPIEQHSEHFHDELNQRLERLRAIRKAIEECPEPQRPARREPSPTDIPAEERSLLSLDDIAIPSPSAAAASLLSPRATEAMPSPTLESPLPAPVPTPAPARKADPISMPTPQPKAPAPAPAWAEPPSETPEAVPAAARPASASIPVIPLERAKVLMVLCSRNGTARQALCRFANRMNVNFEIVDYNPDQPHSLVEQLYHHRDAKFAIVYWGEPTGRELPGSAHPERYVGFALGFALGRLGRGRVFILGSTTTPPLPGFMRILVAQLDSGGGWQIQLARRMKAAGLDLDLNKLT